MSDNFSLDDILAEIDAKKAVKSSDKSKNELDFTVTSIIATDELTKAIKESEKKKKQKQNLVSTITDKIPVFNAVDRQDKKAEKAAKAEAAAREKQAKAEAAAIAAAAERAAKEKSEQEKAEKAARALAEKAEREAKAAAEKAEREAKAAAEKAETEAAAAREKAAKEEPKLVNSQAEKTEKPEKPKKVTPDTQQRRLIESQLEAEESFENPDELIDAINPYEVKSKMADFSALLGGDTRGLAGNELKKLAGIREKDEAGTTAEVKLYKGSESMIANAATRETTAPVKEYVPQKEKEKEKEKPRKMTEKERRSNEALLEKLNKAIARKREEEIEIRRTAGLSGKIENVKSPTQGLNIDYSGKVIQATGVLPDENDLLEVERGRAKRKLRDFVMDEGSEEDEEEEEDFGSYDATGQIWSDLCESHKVIRIRLLLLLIITVFMFFVSLMGDLNLGMEFKLFGLTVTFLDRRANAQGFLFYNLIMGVAAAAICSSVLMNGISKLFKLKADCDSVCAVASVAAIITAAVNIVNTDDIILGRSFVFVPVAIAGLMFNTLGKLMMVVRAKRNFRFVSGDSAKYSANIVEPNAASLLTKGVAVELPCLAAMRKTELLTDFLKSSYCEDKADRLSRNLVPAALAAALLFAVAAYFVPSGTLGLEQNIYWGLTVFTALLSVAAPFSMMFVVNVPLTKAGKALSESDSVILGFEAAEEFSEVNAVMTDASLLFPPGTVIYSNIKHCKQPNSVNNIALDQAIILAASLAIKSGSVMSNMFKDIINDKDDILVKVENCVYEDNMGVLGWYGNKRMIMGSREQMKHHDIKVPDMKKVNRYSTENSETIYLSVGGEIVIMFFVELLPNSEVKSCLQKLTSSGVSIIIKSTDSIITVSKIAEVFDIPPEQIRILPYSLHEQFSAFTRYTSRSSGAMSCNGTFTGFSRALMAAKRLVKDINIGVGVLLTGVLLGVVCGATAAITGNTQLICPSIVTGWNFFWLLAAAVAESIRKY